MIKLSKCYQLLLLSSSLICLDNKSYSSHQSSKLLADAYHQFSSSRTRHLGLRSVMTQDEENALRRFIIEEKLKNENTRNNEKMIHQTTSLLTNLDTFMAYRSGSQKIEGVEERFLLQISFLYKDFISNIQILTEGMLARSDDYSMIENRSLKNNQDFEMIKKNSDRIFQGLWMPKYKTAHLALEKINECIFLLFQKCNLFTSDHKTYKKLNFKKAFGSDRFHNIITPRDLIVIEHENDMLFFKSSIFKSPPIIILNLPRIFFQNILYGDSVVSGKGPKSFLIDKDNLIEDSGFFITPPDHIKKNAGVDFVIQGYYGANTGTPFQNYGCGVPVSTKTQVSNWISAIKDPHEEGFFLPIIDNEHDVHVVQKYILEEIKNIVTDNLNNKNDAQSNLTQVQLMIEGFAPELMKTLEESVEVMNQKYGNNETVNQADIPLVKALQDKVDAYTQMIIAEQQQRTQMVINNSHYESVKVEKKKFKNKGKKVSKKNKDKTVETTNQQNLKINFDQEVTGAIKFRKLAKLIGQMTKDLPEKQIHSIITGSHLNVHGEGIEKQTLVLKSGGASVSASTARKIINGFTSFFQKSVYDKI